ncbi:hypothetical protein LDENG_00186000 [Lucifuga dentata]|nr:hypothetical protein LDENG_00186000 [Lucifuga dentata]
MQNLYHQPVASSTHSSERKWLPDQRRISAVLSVMTSTKILFSCHVATASVKHVCRDGGERNKHRSVQFVRKDHQKQNHPVTWS